MLRVGYCSYLHVVGLTGDLPGGPGQRGRAALIQAIRHFHIIAYHNQVESERKHLVILEKPI